MSDFYSEKFMRNPFGKRAQEKIRKTTFAIVGLGGTGGFILENLLRMGAENFILFDHDRFELSNFNRQNLATDEFIDHPKVHAAVSRAKSINGGISIDTRHEFGPDSDISGAHILLDGVDNIGTKLQMAQLARKTRIPYVFCSAQDSRGIVSVFTTYRFEKAFQVPQEEEALSKYALCSSIICPAASLSGTLAAQQAVNFLLKKPYIKAPDALFFDLFRQEIFWRSELK